jgi:ApbE superfamily uncharacterized protein (UPF0280 family)
MEYRHSRIFIGLDNSSVETARVEEIASGTLQFAYRLLENYGRRQPDFFQSLSPLPDREGPPLIRRMLQAAQLAGVGPMAAVAGALAEEIGVNIRSLCPDVLVENGGDLYIRRRRPSRVRIYSGWGDFSSPLSLLLPAGEWGIASSSGLYGHSFSQGEAEMVTVVCPSAVMADAFATGIANKVSPGCDPAAILAEFERPAAVAIVWQGTLWYRGEFELDVGS